VDEVRCISYGDFDAVTNALRDSLDGEALTRIELLEKITKRLRPKLRLLLKSSWNELLHLLPTNEYSASGHKEAVRLLCQSQEMAQILEKSPDA